jgi:hypothetical protein
VKVGTYTSFGVNTPGLSPELIRFQISHPPSINRSEDSSFIRRLFSDDSDTNMPYHEMSAIADRKAGVTHSPSHPHHELYSISQNPPLPIKHLTTSTTHHTKNGQILPLSHPRAQRMVHVPTPLLHRLLPNLWLPHQHLPKGPPFNHLFNLISK